MWLAIREKKKKFRSSTFCRLCNKHVTYRGWPSCNEKLEKNKAKDPSSSLKTMGRQSKATISRLSNLQKSKNTTFNDVFDKKDTNSDDEDLPDLMSTIYSLSYQSSYANWAARFISAYGQGLSGLEAAWANQKYQSPNIALGYGWKA